MVMLLDLLTALLPLLYGLAAANYSVHFVRHEPFAARTCTPVLLATLGAHGAFLIARGVHLGHYPLSNPGEMLSVMAFAIAAVYLYVERVQGAKETGAFLVGMATLVQLAASALLSHSPANQAALLAKTSLWGVHTICAVLSYSAFFVSAVYGVMYALLYRTLKSKRFGLLFDRLPSLNVLANMGMGAALLGWVFLSLALGLGTLMAVRLVPGFYSDPKFISSVLAWIVYAATVAAYFPLGWRGARTVYASLVAFAVAVIAMAGSVLPWSFHTFQS